MFQLHPVVGAVVAAFAIGLVSSVRTGGRCRLVSRRDAAPAWLRLAGIGGSDHVGGRDADDGRVASAGSAPRAVLG
jgi:hypothetical protein